MVTVLTGKIFCLFKGYHGCSIGKAKQAAKTEIEKLKVRKVCQLVTKLIHGASC